RPARAGSRTRGSGPGACALRARRSRRLWPSDVRRRSRCTSRWVRQSTQAEHGGATSRALRAEVHELERDVEIVLANGLHHDLEIVLGLARDPDLIALDVALDLDLEPFDELHELASLLLRDPDVQVDRLSRG